MAQSKVGLDPKISITSTMDYHSREPATNPKDWEDLRGDWHYPCEINLPRKVVRQHPDTCRGPGPARLTK